MIQKRISSKSWLFFGMLDLILSGGLCIGLSYLLVKYILTSDFQIVASFIFIFGILFSLFLLYMGLIIINRLSCMVLIDLENKIISRKGLLCGFKFDLDSHDIEKVVIVSVSKQSDYIIVIDNENKNIEGLSKKSYIRLEDTDKNIDFIKSIWPHHIPHITTNDYLYYQK